MKKLVNGVFGILLVVVLGSVSLHGWWWKEPIDEKISQKQLEAVINFTTVERLISDNEKGSFLVWLSRKRKLTTEEKQELEEAREGEEAYWSQVKKLKSNGISSRAIEKEYDVHNKALRDRISKTYDEKYKYWKAVIKAKKDRAMADLLEIQRKYLKSTDPEDRNRLYFYEKDVKRENYVEWDKIYESRNKVRQEEKIEKDFELAVLAEVQRKYLSKYFNEKDENARDTLHTIEEYMFDSLTSGEINALRRRIVKEIQEGVHFENITANLQDRDFKEFIKLFAPPLNIQETIESDKDKNFGLLEGRDESANVYAKGFGVSRLFNAERMRNCIEINNFTTLAVPKKWIYKVNGSWRVYAEYIPSGDVTFTLEEIKELVELAEQTGFRDWAHFLALSKEINIHMDLNVMVDKRNGKMIIIDTEDKSFKVEGFMYPDESFPKNCKLQSAYNLYMYFNRYMQDDVKKWFQEHIDYLKNSEEGRVIVEPLPWSGQFDDPNFDFEKIKKELEEDNNRHIEY